MNSIILLQKKCDPCSYLCAALPGMTLSVTLFLHPSSYYSLSAHFKPQPNIFLGMAHTSTEKTRVNNAMDQSIGSHSPTQCNDTWSKLDPINEPKAKQNERNVDSLHPSHGHENNGGMCPSLGPQERCYWASHPKPTTATLPSFKQCTPLGWNPCSYITSSQAANGRSPSLTFHSTWHIHAKSIQRCTNLKHPYTHTMRMHCYSTFAPTPTIQKWHPNERQKQRRGHCFETD